MANKKIIYARKIKALGEKYSLAAYEYLHLDKTTRCGKIKNHFTRLPIKVLQKGREVEELKFTREEVNILTN